MKCSIPLINKGLENLLFKVGFFKKVKEDGTAIQV
jgi:hypothetical protein